MSRSNHQPAAEPTLRGTAFALGLIGAAMAVVATVMVVWGSSDLSSPAVGVLIRVAGILLAISLVLPTLRKPSITTLLLAGAGLVLVMLRPGLIWAALLGWVGWVFYIRRAKTSDNDS